MLVLKAYREISQKSTQGADVIRETFILTAVLPETLG